MRIDELFNRPLEWTKVESRDDYVEYLFSVEDVGMYEVSFSISDEDEGIWELSFLAYGDELPATSRIINTGGKEIQVFSTIKDIVQDFIKNHSSNVSAIEFSSYEPSRTRLYKRLAKMLGKSTEQYYDQGGDSFTHFMVKL